MHSKNLIIKNCKIITPLRMIDNGSIIIEEGGISSVPEGAVSTPPEAKIIDAKGNYASPGFIDIHLHGGGNADVMDCDIESLKTISKVHARGGTTSFLPTTLTAPMEDIYRALEAITKAKKEMLEGAQILGAHIEGPYFSMEQKGAQNPAYIKAPDPKEYLDILENFAETISRVSLAPEIDGALELARTLRDRDILVSIGHTNATYDDVLKAIEAGFSHVTHVFSGMSGLKRIKAYRVSGVIESTLLLDELTTEMIADGHHLPPSLMKLVLKSKSLDKVSLVTDAIAAAGMPPGKYSLGELDIIVEDGVAKLPDRSAFAGSVATMNLLVKNMVNLVRLSLQDAVKMATLNPAKILNIDLKKGTLNKGKDADVVIFNEDIDILMTVVKGKIVYHDKDEISISG